jgi:hypothetical protein
MNHDQETRRAYIVQPGYGLVNMGAAISFLQSTSGSITVNGRPCKVQADLSCREGSLLGHVFNGLWCEARNKNRRERVHYFAMLHSDVVPQQRHWFDVLVEEMEQRDLDVLGAVVPLKDPKGLTSIALDGDDSFRPRCRLTMNEIHQLPETFTSADVGYPLLLNTGCWVCRFDAWAYETHFTINDRIRFDEERGFDVAEVEPEDWNFSRQCNALGLKLGATRKLGVHHIGAARFTNSQPWGDWTFDSDYVAESVLNSSTLEMADEQAELLEV